MDGVLFSSNESLNDVLVELYEFSSKQFPHSLKQERTKGRLFEGFVCDFLRNDSRYADELASVWLWDDWPFRDGPDYGIDVVAQQRTGEYWAIQCKFLHPGTELKRPQIDPLFSATGKWCGRIEFQQCVIATTTADWSAEADRALRDRKIPVFRLGIKEFEESDIDWKTWRKRKNGKCNKCPKKRLRDDQRKAVDCVKNGFKSGPRGQLIMACGTGKTFTSLKLAEEITPQNGHVLFLVPSISLIAQALAEWAAQAEIPMHAFAVCSDTTVGRNRDGLDNFGDISPCDLVFPTTTDAKKLAEKAQKLSAGEPRRTVVFSTYQSIDVVGAAQKMHGFPEFDLIICDEAHRTVGALVGKEGDGSCFLKVHSDENVKGRKRLYMTATPRIYGEASKKRARAGDYDLCTMDDSSLYGPEFYNLCFGDAVDGEILADYKVLIVVVRESEMEGLIGRAVTEIDKKYATAEFVTGIIGSWIGLSKAGLKEIDELGNEKELEEDTKPMRRAVGFCQTIGKSKQIRDTFSALVDMYREENAGQGTWVDCDIRHVDGTMNSSKRNGELQWLKGGAQEGKCRILTNARCLSEGVDVPALDAVIFFDNRESKVGIIQAIGRVMRKYAGKKYGYVILPVGLPEEQIRNGTWNRYIDEDSRFKGVWDVLRALRSHDERLVDRAEHRNRILVIGDGNQEPNGGSGWAAHGKFEFPVIPINEVAEAIYAVTPEHLGDRDYWGSWGKRTAKIAEELIGSIKQITKSDGELKCEFEKFLKGVRDTLNPSVSEEEAVEMLAQHILTLPIFQEFFPGSDFPRRNTVGRAMQRVVDRLYKTGTEIRELDKFYADVKRRISFAKSDDAKQNAIRSLYDTFFQTAFPRTADRLGIVYTPVEVVDFILKSVQFALKKHFGREIGDAGVQILDPFAGTGTFLVRLIQLGLIGKDKLPHKYANEMHANEIMLLPYYIASVNVETAYHAATGEYKPFDGMVLIDTFQMSENGDQKDLCVLPENNEKAERQLNQPITIIMSNPPYSAGQKSENDNNQNEDYPTLDESIKRTYVAKSNAILKRSLYDSYVRAIRWASDRLQGCGIVAFITNGSFIDEKSMDGLRKCLIEEFDHLYIFNLRGAIRGKSQELSKKEGGNIFNIMTGVAISLMIRSGPKFIPLGKLHYYDIGDSLNREEKFAKINDLSSIASIPWNAPIPNAAGDWIKQRGEIFGKFVPMENKIFNTHSCGIRTNRDAWVYNSNHQEMEYNMRRTIDAFNENSKKYAAQCNGIPKSHRPKMENVIDNDSKQINWSYKLKKSLQGGAAYFFNAEVVRHSMYRPFTKQWLYFDLPFIESPYRQLFLFPTSKHKNTALVCPYISSRREFSAMLACTILDADSIEHSRCFPLYWYEKHNATKSRQGEMFSNGGEADEFGYVRREAITDWALDTFREHYGDSAISKEDIFWYVYGILHSLEYKTRFANDLEKMSPRIPFAGNFWAFSKTGRALGKLHLEYETVAPYPLIEETKGPEDWRVTKMAFRRRDGAKDKTAIIYNFHLMLSGIPLKAYEYVVNGRSAIEWIMDRYQIRTDKASGIRNDPNDWSDDPRYIVNLLKSIVTVSMETVALVVGLPPLGLADSPSSAQN